MKKQIKKQIRKTTQVIIRLIILMIMFSSFAIVYAQEYVPLAPVPGVGEGTGKTTTNLQEYIPAAFRLTIGIAAGMAFVVITIGGVMYATSDAISGKSQGREWIENAIWGLLLVIGAYAILYTINPRILEFSLSLDRPPQKTGSPAGPGDGILPGYKLTEDQITTNEKMYNDLKNMYHVNTNNGPCLTAEVTTGCTNLVGLPDVAYRGVATLKSQCDKITKTTCGVTITGGTEGGHKEHGPGKPIMDLAKNANLDKYIDTIRLGPMVMRGSYPAHTARLNNRPVTFVDEGDHWHVIYQ